MAKYIYPTEVTTDRQTAWKALCLPKGQKKTSAEGQCPPQEVEVGPHSGIVLYNVLVCLMLLPSCVICSVWRKKHLVPQFITPWF